MQEPVDGGGRQGSWHQSGIAVVDVRLGATRRAALPDPTEVDSPRPESPGEWSAEVEDRRPSAAEVEDRRPSASPAARDRLRHRWVGSVSPVPPTEESQAAEVERAVGIAALVGAPIGRLGSGQIPQLLEKPAWVQRCDRIVALIGPPVCLLRRGPREVTRQPDGEALTGDPLPPTGSLWRRFRWDRGRRRIAHLTGGGTRRPRRWSRFAGSHAAAEASADARSPSAPVARGRSR